MIPRTNRDETERWWRRTLKQAAAIMLGDYRISRIYCLSDEVPPPSAPSGVVLSHLDAIPEDVEEQLLARFSYSGDDAQGFGASVEDQLAGVCWFWGARRFHDPLLWDLHDGQAMLVDLWIMPEHRSRGLAPVLIQYAAAEMRRLGADGLYTWIWHTHRASARAFLKAGWSHVAWVAEVHPPGLRQPLRLCWLTRAGRILNNQRAGHQRTIN